jgi:hypothetical protein
VNFYVVPTHVCRAKDTSVTAHCHAAPAQLTGEYQSDHRRDVLTPATTGAAHLLITPRHPLTNTFHIRSFIRADKPVFSPGRSRQTSVTILAPGARPKPASRLVTASRAHRNERES